MSKEVSKKDKGANVKISPPLIYVFWMVVGGIIQKYYPIDMGIPFDYQYIGLGIFLAEIGFIIYSFKIFKRAKTNIKPWEPTERLITTGVFQYSRNPLYLMFNLMPIGLGIFFDNFWLLISLFPSAYFLYHIAIKKEEAYLEVTFGEEYLEYKKKVRRWI